MDITYTSEWNAKRYERVIDASLRVTGPFRTSFFGWCMTVCGLLWLCSVHRYGRANGGAIPSDLSALVPTYLAEVPRDPFSPDRALGYDATTRQIWTVGPDGDFNALDSAQTVKYGFKRKRAKCTFLLDGKRIER